jgi:hypothetical protein
MPVLESVPSSERIIQDVKNVFKSLEIIHKEKGVKVDGVGNTNVGVRYLPVLIKKSGGGGSKSEQRTIMGTALQSIGMRCKQQRSSSRILRKFVLEVSKGRRWNKKKSKQRKRRTTEIFVI